MPTKTLLSWSSGKDSAWALHVLRQWPEYEVVGLFCTVNQAFNRVAMHAVRTELILRQAQSVGLPIQLIQIPYPCSNADYERIMGAFVAEVAAQGIECFAFGDLFLEDVRRYRERSLADTGITPVFPLWGMPTATLAGEMVAAGLRARISCVDPRALPPAFCGEEYGERFLQALPDGVDPCGENGEFHSFAYDGPMFEQAIDTRAGETVTRDGFTFTDLLPV